MILIIHTVNASTLFYLAQGLKNDRLHHTIVVQLLVAREVTKERKTAH